ncbi:MAG: caspase family protein, partial [Pseudomonadota bacterium]
MALLFSGSADAKKIALIIGNSNYDNTTTLANPINDAMLIAASADEAGFDDVILALDLTTNEFQHTLRDFRTKAEGADVAMVYYAGHGIEGRGKNWLIPVNAKLEASLDLPYEAVELDRVMESLSGAQIRMVVIDACRNNPFARLWRSSTRAVRRGLIGVEADDVLVIYAAAPGQT